MWGCRLLMGVLLLLASEFKEVPEALAGYEAAEGITVMMRCTGIQ